MARSIKSPQSDSESSGFSSDTPSDPTDDQIDKPLESFRVSIASFVAMAESDFPTSNSIRSIITQFGFQQRRLYDVTNVLIAIGCCTKISPESIFWHGLSRIRPTLLKIQSQVRVDHSYAPLEEIIRSDPMISISKLTVALLLCFLTLRTQSLDIKQVGKFLARMSGRYKSTLCKLYQIAHILEASGIVERSITPGEITLLSRFYVPMDFNRCETVETRDPFSIEALLNRPRGPEDAIIERRRMEFITDFQHRGVRVFSLDPRMMGTPLIL
jgi:hypothetical protein